MDGSVVITDLRGKGSCPRRAVSPHRAHTRDGLRVRRRAVEVIIRRRGRTDAGTDRHSDRRQPPDAPPKEDGPQVGHAVATQRPPQHTLLPRTGRLILRTWHNGATAHPTTSRWISPKRNSGSPTSGTMAPSNRNIHPPLSDGRGRGAYHWGSRGRGFKSRQPDRMKLQVSNAAPSSRRTVVREDSVPFERCGAGVVGFRLAVFVVVDPDVPCGAREPVGQHGGGGLHGNRGLVP